MSAGGRRAQPSDLDLRIKAGAAFTCDLSARVGSSGSASESGTRRISNYVDSPSRLRDDHAWVRRIVYLAFAIAITIPWVLLLVGQLSD